MSDLDLYQDDRQPDIHSNSKVQNSATAWHFLQHYMQQHPFKIRYFGTLLTWEPSKHFSFIYFISNWTAGLLFIQLCCQILIRAKREKKIAETEVSSNICIDLFSTSTELFTSTPCWMLMSSYRWGDRIQFVTQNADKDTMEIRDFLFFWIPFPFLYLLDRENTMKEALRNICIKVRGSCKSFHSRKTSFDLTADDQWGLQQPSK